MPAPLHGWVSTVWNYQPWWLSWIFKLYYLQYLCIVIPGTIAGDLILQWTRRSETQTNSEPSPAWRMITILLLMIAFVLVLLVGLKSRWLIATSIAAFAMCGVGWWLFSRPRNETGHLYKALFQWASYWLILGLFFEPYEGGIRKDHPTVSYYFVTSGMAVCALIAFSIVIDIFQRRSWLQLLIDNGQNPMIAYAGINNFIAPILALTGLDAALMRWADTSWRGFWQGMIITLLMAVTVGICSRCRIFWRT
jgi:hypothetical protein